MNVLVTGAKGMVGTALCNNLKNIRDGKNKTRSEIAIEEIYEYDLGSTAEELDEYCQKSDFVFNLAGVNRPENPEDFMKGNFGFASALLNCLKKHNNNIFLLAFVPAVICFISTSNLQHTVGNEVLASPIALNDCSNQVLRHIGIICE